MNPVGTGTLLPVTALATAAAFRLPRRPSRTRAGGGREPPPDIPNAMSP